MQFKQFEIRDCNKYRFFLYFLRKRMMKKEFEKHKIRKENKKTTIIENEKKVIQMDLEDIKKLPINKNYKSRHLIDISFWILGELYINLNLILIRF